MLQNHFIEEIHSMQEQAIQYPHIDLQNDV